MKQLQAAGPQMGSVNPASSARQILVSRSAIASRVAANPGLTVKEDAAPLFTSFKIGKYELQHRVIMAPLTRCRAPNNLPVPDMATYYAQRASLGGLIISEGAVISEQARGYPNTPGIWTAEQVAAWQPVTQAVRDRGGVFFCQLWHVGRASHPDYQLGGAAPVSASAVPVGDGSVVFTPRSEACPFPTPRALQLDEIPGLVQQFVDAARNAIAAGFHGVEVHAANGYIIDQFWKDNTNLRTDAYGGSTANKARLMLQVLEAVAAAVGEEHVGVRLCPYNVWMDATDGIDAAVDKNVWLMQELQQRLPDLAYVHMVEPRVAGGNVELEGELGHSLAPFRQACGSPFLVAGGHSRASAIAPVSSGQADGVVFGRFFVANPDLPQRLALDAPLNPYNRDTFYTPGLEGYTDYPFLNEQQVVVSF